MFCQHDQEEGSYIHPFRTRTRGCTNECVYLLRFSSLVDVYDMKRKRPDDDEDHLLNLDFARKYLFKEPRVRQDVAARKARNKETSCSVVKSTLNQFCKASSVGIRTPLNIIVREVNRTVAEAYLLANLHVNRMIEAGQPLGPLDQSFFYGCLSAVSTSGRRKTEIRDMRFRESAELYHSWSTECPGHEEPCSQYLASGFHQQASLQMVTNTRVAVCENFGRRFKRYLKHKYQLEGSASWSTLRSILADAYGGEDHVVLEYRSQMPSKPAKGGVEDYPHLVLPLTHKFLRYFEAQHAQAAEDEQYPGKALRLFSLLPNKAGFECTHIKLCNNGLYGLLKRAGLGLELPSDGPEWRAVAPSFWRRIFNVERFETVNRKFAGEILTDGHAVSIVMRKPKTETGEPRPISLEDYGDIHGLDPGRTDLFTTCDLHGEHRHHSTKRFRHDATFKASLKTIEGWMDRHPLAKRVNAELPTRKTSHLQTLRQHILYVLPVLDQMLQWHMDKPFRKLKLRRYIASKKALQRICDELTSKAGSKTLIGFGDWSNCDRGGIIKGSPAGPVKKLEGELRKRCRVVSVDEFRTSKVHTTCGGLLHNRCCHKHYKAKDEARGHVRGELKGAVRVHKVLSCANSCCSGISMDRDENASRNILRLLLLSAQGQPRPPVFTRGLEMRENMPAPFGEVGVWPVHSGIIIPA